MERWWIPSGTTQKSGMLFIENRGMVTKRVIILDEGEKLPIPDDQEEEELEKGWVCTKFPKGRIYWRGTKEKEMLDKGKHTALVEFHIVDWKTYEVVDVGEIFLHGMVVNDTCPGTELNLLAHFLKRYNLSAKGNPDELDVYLRVIASHWEGE